MRRSTSAAEEAQSGMAAVLVVPTGNQLEDGQLRLATGWPDMAVDQLRLEGGEEALGHRIVPAGAGPTDALARLMGRQQLAVDRTGVLVYWLPRSVCWISPGFGRRVSSAICSAAVASSVRRWSAMARPTILRL